MALQALSAATGRLVARRPGTIVLTTLVITVLFATVLVIAPPVPSSDSFEGSGEAVLAEDRMDQNLPPTGFGVPFVMTGTTAAPNALARDTFDEVLALERALREDEKTQPYLFTYNHPHLQMQVSSVWSLPDTLRAVMDGDTSLSYVLGWHEAVGGPGVSYARATDAQWQDALTRLLEFEPREGEQPFKRLVSVDARQENGVWTAHSMFVVPSLHYQTVFADHVRDPSQLTGDKVLIDDIQLHIESVFEDRATRTEWIGLGIGINEEIEREIAASGQLVILSFVLIGVFLYLTLRNFRDWVAAYLALPVVIVWMLGAARLLDVSYNQFTAMLPVLILALAVDFAIHGVRRYREERGQHAPAEAVRRSVGLLGPALILAAGTTATAFLSNAFSSVEALRDWGIEGGVAILAALWVCGVHTPAMRHLWDKRRVAKGRLDDEARASVTARRLEEGTLLGRLAVRSGRHPWIVIAILALVTLPAVVAATQITSDFDANDFLDDESELIQGVELVAEDYPSEGEPAIWLVEADLGDPAVMDALARAIENMADADLSPERDFNLVRLIRTAMEYPEDNDATGYTDNDGNGIPDTRADLERLLDRALQHGVRARVPVPQPNIELAPGVPAPEPLRPDIPQYQVVIVYNANTVRELVHPDGAGGYDMTPVWFGIPDTSDFANIPKAADAVRASGAELYAMDDDQVQRLTLTGEPFKRYQMVNSITDSLQISITLSILIVFVIVLAVFRDLLYAIVTVIPVLVLVAWLFAFMVAIDLSLNLVTVTVAAMAIGVGIDYSIHITERFREEVHRNRATPLAGLRRAMDSSGIALMGSAITTIAGFLVLTMAPMPLFTTFGLITAAMAAASFLAAATILPPLLVLVANRRSAPSTPTTARSAASATRPTRIEPPNPSKGR